MLVTDDYDGDDDDYNNNAVAYRPVTGQRPRNKRDNSCCYAMIVRWAVVLDPFLGNGLLNTSPQQRLTVQLIVGREFCIGILKYLSAGS
jgi:hypothetical protein